MELLCVFEMSRAYSAMESFGAVLVLLLEAAYVCARTPKPPAIAASVKRTSASLLLCIESPLFLSVALP